MDTLGRIKTDFGLKFFLITLGLAGVAALVIGAFMDVWYWTSFDKETATAAVVGFSVVAAIFHLGAFAFAGVAGRLFRDRRWIAFGLVLLPVAFFTAVNAFSLFGFGATYRIKPIEVAKIDQQLLATQAQTQAMAASDATRDVAVILSRQLDKIDCSKIRNEVRQANCLSSQSRLLESLTQVQKTATTSAPPPSKVDPASIDVQARIAAKYTPVSEEDWVAISVAALAFGVILMKVAGPMALTAFWPTPTPPAAPGARAANDNPGEEDDDVADAPVDTPDEEPEVRIAANLTQDPAQLGANADRVVECFETAFRQATTTAPHPEQDIFKRYRAHCRERGWRPLTLRAFGEMVERLNGLRRISVARQVRRDGSVRYYGIAPNFDADYVTYEESPALKAA